MEPVILRHAEIPVQKLGDGVFLRILADSITGAHNIGMGWITFKPGEKSSMHSRDEREKTIYDRIFIKKSESFN